MHTTGIHIRMYVRRYGSSNAKEGEAREERNKRSAEDEREREKRGESMGGGHRGDGVSDLPKVARRSTRAAAARPQRDATAAAAAEEEVVEEAEGETEAGGGGGGGEGGVGAGGMDMVVRWPEGGVVTVDWVMGLGNVLDYASRNLQPSQLPDVIPVSVADSLILAASKVCILAYWVGGGVGGGGGVFFWGFSLSVCLCVSLPPFECRPFA